MTQNETIELKNTKGKFEYLFHWKNSRIKIDKFGNLSDAKMVIHQMASAINSINETETVFVGSSIDCKNKIYFYYFHDLRNNNIYCLSNRWFKIQNKNGKYIDIIHNGNCWELIDYKKYVDEINDLWILGRCRLDLLESIVNSTNYNGGTFADFKFIGEIPKEKMIYLDLVDHNDFQFKKIVADVLKVSVLEIEFLFNSWSVAKKTGSVYYKSVDEKYLIRVSDHWTDSNSKKVYKVQNIKSSRWNLKCGLFKKPKFMDSMKIGIVKFDNMKKIKDNIVKPLIINDNSKIDENNEIIKNNCDNKMLVNKEVSKIVSLENVNYDSFSDAVKINFNNLVSKIDSSIYSFCEMFKTETITIEMQKDKNYSIKLLKIFNRVSALKSLIKCRSTEVDNLINELTYMKKRLYLENKENKLLKYIK